MEQMQKNVQAVTSKLKENSERKYFLPSLQFFANGGSDNPGDDADDSSDDNTDESGDDKSGSNDDSTSNNDDGTEDSSDDSSNTDKKKDKSFTQDDVSKIAAREAKKAQEKILKELGVKNVKSAKQGLSDYKKQQDAQKTDAEKAIERAKTLEDENSANSKTLKTLETKVSAMKADVDPKSVDDVVVLANNLVDDDTDIDAAIEKVIEKYPQFKRASNNADDADDTDSKKKKKKPKFTNGDHTADNTETDKEKWQTAFKWGN